MNHPGLGRALQPAAGSLREERKGGWGPTGGRPGEARAETGVRGPQGRAATPGAGEAAADPPSDPPGGTGPVTPRSQISGLQN